MGHFSGVDLIPGPGKFYMLWVWSKKKRKKERKKKEILSYTLKISCAIFKKNRFKILHLNDNVYLKINES